MQWAVLKCVCGWTLYLKENLRYPPRTDYKGTWQGSIREWRIKRKWSIIITAKNYWCQVCCSHLFEPFSLSRRCYQVHYEWEWRLDHKAIMWWNSRQSIKFWKSTLNWQRLVNSNWSHSCSFRVYEYVDGWFKRACTFYSF
jgi:hypothetical protein